MESAEKRNKKNQKQTGRNGKSANGFGNGNQKFGQIDQAVQ